MWGAPGPHLSLEMLLAGHELSLRSVEPGWATFITKGNQPSERGHFFWEEW